MLGQHALFDPAVIRVPSPEEDSSLGPNADGEWELRVLREGEVTQVFYPYCPLDVVGWKGTLAPLQLNVRDIRPVVSRALPPAAVGAHHVRHAQRGRSAPSCRGRSRTAIPRALKVPFFHSNIDFDEVLFYHRGRVLQPRRASRRGC